MTHVFLPYRQTSHFISCLSAIYIIHGLARHKITILVTYKNWIYFCNTNCDSIKNTPQSFETIYNGLVQQSRVSNSRIRWESFQTKPLQFCTLPYTDVLFGSQISHPPSPIFTMYLYISYCCLCFNFTMCMTIIFILFWYASWTNMYCFSIYLYFRVVVSPPPLLIHWMVYLYIFVLVQMWT